MATITVSDIARRIQRPGEDQASVVDRLRNWTKEGLLRPVGDKNPGTGRPRRYPEEAVIDALVLSTLTELGIPAVKVGQMRGAEKTLLQFARMAASEFEKRELAGEYIYLGIHRTYDRTYDASSAGAHATVILHITKNIPASHDSAKPARLERSFEDITIPHWTEASIVLNLTTLFRHLRKPMKDHANG